MRRDSGFTLLEILLVLVLVAFASVMVISTLPVQVEASAKQQAQSLYHRLQLLNEEAMLRGVDYGVHIDEQNAGYALFQLKGDGWQPIDGMGLPDHTELEDKLALSLLLGGSVWVDRVRLFEAGSLFDEEMFAEDEQEKYQPPPQVLMMSSGEVTPFSIAIYPQDADAEREAWHIVTQENGQILLSAPGASDEQ